MRRHAWFGAALAAGAALRLVAMLGYRPALWFPDSFSYMVTAMRPRPDLIRPPGYAFFLRALEPFHSLGLVAAVQHLLGLGIATLVYAVAVRRGAPRWAGVLAALPVLLDPYQVQLEHLLLSDTLFTFCVVAAVAVALWPRPARRTADAAQATQTAGTAEAAQATGGGDTTQVAGGGHTAQATGGGDTAQVAGGGHTAQATGGGHTARVAGGGDTTQVAGGGHTARVAGGDGFGWRAGLACGALLGVAAVTRTVGLPLLVLLAGWLAVRARAWRGWRRAVPAVVALVAGVAPVAAYALWFQAAHGVLATSTADGVILYGRTMVFADCARMDPPERLRVLCDDRPPGRRPGTQYYIWDHSSPLRRLPGVQFRPENNALAMEFAMSAIRAQPLDYAAVVLRDLARSFTWTREVFPSRAVYDAYEFPASASPLATDPTTTKGAMFARRYERGPVETRVERPWADLVRGYQEKVWFPGLALLLALLLPLAARLSARARRAPGAGVALPWLFSAALLAMPVAVAEFDYRYVLPAVPLALLSSAMTAGLLVKVSPGGFPPEECSGYAEPPVGRSRG
ncbi:phospholipid carrier-dependent glycosyltransferase [Bailinhaonella thermotolerans]|uniref:phospholipid carrier-dependent glycosyltransferase n=1 Tax=Bailinhaonella thermotolerans TaxID=1070861 RepID=UPI00192A517E|nr:phospholipid carrier-dependent glycosyltransferase [Bailinhaonella thermotolerans]